MSSVNQAKQTATKDVFLVEPSELVLDRDWNGRWQAIPNERDATALAAATAAAKNPGLPAEGQLPVSVREIANSIKIYGQLEDVLVCRKPADASGRTLYVIAGQTRVRAFLLLNRENPDDNHKVRVRVWPGDISARDAFFFNEEENRTRNNLTLLDKSYCMKRERELGMAVKEIADRWGCTVQAIDQALRLISAPPEVQTAVYDKVISATDVIASFKNVPENDQISIVTRAREAKAKGTPFRAADIKTLARQYTTAAPHTPTPTPGATPDPNVTPDPNAAPGTTPANGTTPPAPATKRRGRPASPDRKVPRGVADLRAALKDRDGVLSQALLRYFDGYVDMGDNELASLLDKYEYENVEDADLEPRTEGNEIPAGATTTA